MLSVGDNFSGSYFSRITRGNPLPEMFREMDVKMSAVGNHEFDWGLPYLTDTAKVYMNFVAANIISERGFVGVGKTLPDCESGDEKRRNGACCFCWIDNNGNCP